MPRTRAFTGGVRNLVLPGPLLFVLLFHTALALPSPVRSAPIVELDTIEFVSPSSPEPFVAPSALAVDHRGRFLVADAGRHVVMFFGQSGRFIDEFGGFGWEAGRFDGPSDLAVLQGFSIFVLDEGNRRVARFDESGDFSDIAIGEGDAGTPVGVALGPASELYLVDSDTQTVLVRSQFDEVLEPFGRFGSGEGGLVRPVDAAVGPGLILAVADPGREAVLVFDEFGAELAVATTSDTLEPSAVAFDRHGNLLVADRRRGRVVAFALPGGAPTAEARLAAAADGFVPVSLSMDAAGDILVLDGETGDIARVRPVYSGRTGSR